MEKTTSLIIALTELVDSLSRFLENNGTVAYFGTLGFLLAGLAIHTIGKMVISVYSKEIYRLVESRNRVHDAFLEDRKTSKLKKAPEEEEKR